MHVGSGEHTYEWIDTWAKVPDSPSTREGWSHHGVVVSETGEVISFHQEDRTVLVFDAEGNLNRSWPSGLTEAHGMTLVKEGDAEVLWFADNGRKRFYTDRYEYPDGDVQVTGRVVKKTLDGETLLELNTPPLSAYDTGNYMPTWVAVHEERMGGSGDVWVADGYGQNYVHRFTKDGGYVASINGEEGDAGAFSCPHAIFIDYRKPEAELYVADRTNGRVQVYDVDGAWKRTFGADFLTSPSGFATDGDLMVIVELRARLTIVDLDDKLVTYLGANEEVCEVPGWPNNQDEGGKLIRPKVLEPGKFNSPHGMTVDPDGNIYVAEWLIGGRFVKLVKA